MSLQISLVFVSDRLHSREDSERKEGSPAPCLKLMTCHNNMETGTKRHITTTPCRGITWRVLATVRSYRFYALHISCLYGCHKELTSCYVDRSPYTTLIFIIIILSLTPARVNKKSLLFHFPYFFHKFLL